MQSDPAHNLFASRPWLRILTLNVVVGAMVGAVLALGGRTGAATLFMSLAYAQAIGVAGAVVLPPLVRRLDAQRAWPAWFVLPVALLGLAAVGGLLVGLGAVAFGMVPPGQLWRITWPSTGIAAATVLGLGMGIALNEHLRAERAAVERERHALDLAREEARRLAAQTRAAAIEARLRPHFVYNTLNTIIALIPQAADRATRLVVDLGAVLQYSLDPCAPGTVTLAAELAAVRAYLGVQQARLEHLDTAIDVPDALGACRIPSFALLTLVENSVVHVAQARQGPTRLRIEARAEGESLHLGVWDDGPGFLLSAMAEGHGLDLLCGRLQALYGSAAALSVDRGDGGALVALRLPRQEEDGV